MSREGLVGCVGGEVVPGFDFEDRADRETGFGAFVKEGSAGFSGIESVHVLGFEEFN